MSKINKYSVLNSLKTKDSQLKTPKAFTLVELIVVIVILAILATIAFLSFSSQSVSARDSTRLSDITNITKGLQVFNALSSKYPNPDSYITITASGSPIIYQGKAGNSLLSMIKISNGGKDPLDNSYFTYATNTSQSKYQLLGFLEDGSNISLSYSLPIHGLSRSFAADYSKRFSLTKGDNIGILLSSGTLDPAENQISPTFTGVDIVSTTTAYKVQINNQKTLTGTGGSLKILSASNKNNPITYAKSCKDIFDMGFSQGDGIYYINPTQTLSFQAYCDMTTDGGGWTLVAATDSTNFNHVNVGEVTPANLTSLNLFGKYSDSVINKIMSTGYRLQARSNLNLKHIWDNQCIFSSTQTALLSNNCLSASNGGTEMADRVGLAHKDGSATNDSYVYGYGLNQATWVGGSYIYGLGMTSAYFWAK